MGLFGTSSKGPKNKEPLQDWGAKLGPTATGIHYGQELILKLREKKVSLSGDSFEITTTDGNPFMKTVGSVMSLRDKKVLYDANNRPILNIQNKLITIHKEYRVFSGDSESEQILRIRGHWTLIGGAKMTAYFMNRADGSNRDMELHLDGDFFDRDAKITCEGRTVAKIDRNILNLGEALFDKQTYFLSIAPGVDVSMMVALCICLDEKANEK